MKYLNREIARLSIPAILSNITMPLLSLSDTTICGHLGSEIYIGAVAVGSMMLNVVFWLFGFLRMGTTGLTAQAYGRGDEGGQAEVFSRAFTLAMVFGAAIIVLRTPLKHLMTWLISPPPDDVLPLAQRYFDICIMGAPAMLGTMAVTGWLLGTQTTLLPMIATIAINLLNISLSVSLVFVFGVGFEGVAIGTLAANWFGLFFVLGLALWRSRGHRLWAGWKAVLSTSGMARFFRVNGDIFFRSGCILAVSMTVTAIGARLGATTLAVNAVMVQFYIFFSYFMDGFAFTGEALCGRFAGEGNAEMLHRTVRYLLWWSAAMAASFLLIYLVGHNVIVGLITDDADVIAAIRPYTLWLILTPPLSVLAFIFDGFYIGLTATRRMLAATVAAAAFFFAVCFVHPGSPQLFGLPTNHYLWGAFMGYLLIRGVMLAAWSRSTFNIKENDYVRQC